MKQLDQAVRNAFLAAVHMRGVPAGDAWNHVKWLRYYLDFCDKYRRETLDPESLQAFLLKLASKSQSAVPSRTQKERASPLDLGPHTRCGHEAAPEAPDRSPEDSDTGGEIRLG